MPIAETIAFPVEAHNDTVATVAFDWRGKEGEVNAGTDVRNPTVIVVDDDVATRRIVALLLKNKGWSVLEAGCGRTAAQL